MIADLDILFFRLLILNGLLNRCNIEWSGWRPLIHCGRQISSLQLPQFLLLWYQWKSPMLSKWCRMYILWCWKLSNPGRIPKLYMFVWLRFKFIILVDLSIEGDAPCSGVYDGGEKGPSLLLLSSQHTTKYYIQFVLTITQLIYINK